MVEDTLPGGATPPIAASATLAEGDAAAPPVTRGAVLGRYVTQSVLGAGAMGVVYAAHDPELDRKIALKVLRDGPRSPHGARLLREARTLARLEHPNVVSVHDIGVAGDELFIAMEFVEGQTVTAWLRERRRSTQEVLEVFTAAGRGLAAAHRARIVHRDFKPDNIMVGSEGRVRVLDFGLARAGEASDELETGQTLPQASSDSGDTELTRRGTVLGTPAYMAPEQWQGEVASARSDQFAFAVALWEALYGQRPFRGETMPALMSSVLAGKIEAVAAPDRRVPPALRRVLGRALTSAPERRFADMDALLAAIGRALAQRRRRAALLALGVVGLCAGAMFGVRAQRLAACEAAGAEIATVWNDSAKAALHATLVGTGASYAETSYARAAARIDAWTAAWSSLRSQACREATVDDVAPPDLYARSTECLEGRSADLAALLAVFTDPDTTDVEQLVPTIAELAPLDPCGDRSALLRHPRLPDEPELRARVMALRGELLRLHGLQRVGRASVALRQADELLAAVEATAYRPLAVEAALLVGGLAAQRGQYDRAEELLSGVYRDAGAIGDDDTAALAAVRLVKLVGVERGRPEQGAQWVLSAEVLVQRLGQERGLLGANLLSNQAQVLRARGMYAEAVATGARALAIHEESLGPNHPIVAATLSNLANVERDRGNHEAALAALQRALAIRQEALGADHPAVAGTLNNLGLLEQSRGNYGEAQEYLERALVGVKAAFGGDSLDAATTYDNLGRVHHMRGNYQEAQALLERALAIRERRLGPRHLDVALSLQNLALLHLVRGERLAARDLLERVLTIRERQLDESSPAIVTVLDNLGTVHYRLGELERARTLHERVLELQRAQRGPGHVAVAHSLRNLALVHWAGGDGEQALARANEALAVGEAALGPDHPDVATFLNTLGTVQRGRDGAAAEANLRRALALSTRTRGPRHPGTALSRQRLGEVLVDRGALDEAGEHLEQALAIREAVGPNSPEVADVLVSLGELALARGRADEAITRLERAVELRRGAGIPAYELAAARFSLARALRESSAGAARDPARARALAEEAAAGYRAAGDQYRARAAAIDAWSRGG